MNMMYYRHPSFLPLRACVRHILEHPEHHPWSIQGFGMLRTYLDADNRWRLNIWHSRFMVPEVSIIHDHPWDFTSWIIAGSIANIRFREDLMPPPSHEWMVIKTGEGGGPDGVRGTMYLRPQKPEIYMPGDSYRQLAQEIHASYYDDGAVTLNNRHRRERREDGEHARVFWPAGEQWVTAEPREATPEEVNEITSLALSKLVS